MNQLTVVNNNPSLSSLEVAEMMGKEHKNLLRDIGTYTEYLMEGQKRGELKIEPSDYFIESIYINLQNKQQPCYNITKKGCELIAHKMTGRKGTLFSASYIERFHEMESALKNEHRLPGTYKEALLALLDSVEQNEKLHTNNLVLTQQVNELQPKASYYDLVLQNKSLLSITMIAKDFGMTGQAMNNLLHDRGIQFKQGGIWLLYAKYQDKGYTQTHTHVVDAEKSKISTKWTQKGRLFIYDLLKSQGVLPLIERNQAI